MSVEPGKTTLMKTETINQSCEGKNVCNDKLLTTMQEDGKTKNLIVLKNPLN